MVGVRRPRRSAGPVEMSMKRGGAASASRAAGAAAGPPISWRATPFRFCSSQGAESNAPHPQSSTAIRRQGVVVTSTQQRRSSPSPRPGSSEVTRQSSSARWPGWSPPRLRQPRPWAMVARWRPGEPATTGERRRCGRGDGARQDSAAVSAPCSLIKLRPLRRAAGGQLGAGPSRWPGTAHIRGWRLRRPVKPCWGRADPDR